MAREVVVQISCSRCDRVEHRSAPATPIAASNEPSPNVPAFAAALVGVNGQCDRIVFEDLCAVCIRSIATHLHAIGKKIEGLSPKRGKEEKDDLAEVHEVGARKKAHA